MGTDGQYEGQPTQVGPAGGQMQAGPGYAYPPPPPPQYYGYGQGGPWGGMRQRPSYPIETKPFYLTSEFALSVIAVVGIAITAASSNAFGSWRAWVLITAILVAYNLSRGIAKSGIKSRAFDPREELELGRRDGGGSGDHANS
jgi:hypothetical protein